MELSDMLKAIYQIRECSRDMNSTSNSLSRAFPLFHAHFPINTRALLPHKYD